ncbi:MAG TPA: RDD family protein [Saprospiraceae bacterium]|nr:RDD family protein [Saprospiraceae bacterium]HMQ83074.1 RDD family protein [Saprospiraceae bacterium]
MEDILDDLMGEDRPTKEYKDANKNKRFINHIIDMLGYMVFSFIIGALLGPLSVLFSMEDAYVQWANSDSNPIEDWLFGIFVVMLYYTGLEYLLKGKTLGKFITKTRAVTLEDEEMNFSTTLIRSLCRIVPFEAFSFLGDDPGGWHDKWSRTRVIDDENWVSGRKNTLRYR